MIKVRGSWYLAALSLLLVALPASAEDLESALTREGQLLLVDRSTQRTLTLIERDGSAERRHEVPATSGPAAEVDARLAYDHASHTAFLVWRELDGDTARLLVSAFDCNDRWSPAQVVTSGARHGDRSPLHLQLARGTGGAAFLHILWQNDVRPEYALVTFRGTEHVASDVLDLATWADWKSDQTDRSPLLAMEQVGGELLLAFAPSSTSPLMRATLPLKPGSDWKIRIPSGRKPVPAPQPNIASDEARAVILGQRVVVYTTDTLFRYTVLEGDQWSRIRKIRLDGKHSVRELLQALQRQ